jgi:hypothetical protein
VNYQAADSETGGADDGLFYESLINGYVHTDAYVRREWLENAIFDRIRRPGCRYVLVVGEPGAGKTGVLAGLADQHPEWLRYFIRGNSTMRLSEGDAVSMLIRIGHQLAARQPGLFDEKRLEVVVSQRFARSGPESSVVGVHIEDLQASPFHRTAIRVEQQGGWFGGKLVGLEVTHATTNPRLLSPQTLQYLALLDPAQAQHASDPDAQVVVLIDALDEVFNFRGEMSILHWLENSPELPANVRIVLSSRPHSRLKNLEGIRAGSIERIELDTSSSVARKDTHVFSRRMLAKPGVAERLSDIDAAAAEFTRASDGNFAYLGAYERALRAAVEDGSDSAVDALLRLDLLPQGLGALYAALLRKVRVEISELAALDIEQPTGSGDQVAPAWEGAGRRMLCVLAVARAPVTLEQLMRLGSIRVWRSQADIVLQQLRPFLDEVSGAWRFFHSSVAEFLLRDAASEAPDLQVDGAEWHQRAVRAYRSAANWDAVDWESVDDYGLQHLAGHLIELGHAGRDDLLALVNPGLRTAARTRFLTDLPFQRIVDTAIAVVSEYADPAKALAATVFLDVIRRTLSTSGRALAPAVFGLLAALGRVEEAQSRVDLLVPGAHKFASQQAIVACAPAAQRELLGDDDGAGRLVRAALEIPLTDNSPLMGWARDRAIEAAAAALAPQDLERALAVAAHVVNRSIEARDAVLAAAAQSVVPGDAMTLLDQMRAGRATAAVDIARRSDPSHRDQLLQVAEECLDAEEAAGRIAVLSGLAAGWGGWDPRRAEAAASRLRGMITGPGAAEMSREDWKAILRAATTVRDTDPDLATWLLDRIDELDDAFDEVKIPAVGLWAAWGESRRCLSLAQRVLGYERAQGWSSVNRIAELAAAVREAAPDLARQLADEAEQFVVAAVSATRDEFERLPVELVLANTVHAFRTWDPERALRIADHLSERGWVNGSGWDSFLGRTGTRACLAIDKSRDDIELARQLLEECMLTHESPLVIGRPDATSAGGEYFTLKDSQAQVTGELPYFRVANFTTAVTNRVQSRTRDLDRRAFIDPASVARHIAMTYGPAYASWAAVISSAVDVVAARDATTAITIAGWISDPCERLIACAALVRKLANANDARAAKALDALGRAAVRLPRYVAEPGIGANPQAESPQAAMLAFTRLSTPVLDYLNPSIRARWEAALLLPQEYETIASALTAATGSRYLEATRNAQRMKEALLAIGRSGVSKQHVIDEIEKILTHITDNPDAFQRDLVHAVAVTSAAAWDPVKAAAILPKITDPWLKLQAELYLRATSTRASTVADLNSAGLMAVLKPGPAKLPAHQWAHTARWAMEYVSYWDSASADELANLAVGALAGADALTRAWGMTALADTVARPRGAEFLREALRLTDEVADLNDRNEVLADMLRSAAATGDKAVVIAVARKLCAAGWLVLMEGLRRAIGPLLSLTGLDLIDQLDKALRAAQWVVGDSTTRPHLDGVAAPSYRVPILESPAATAASHLSDFASVFLTAGDLPGMTISLDSLYCDPDPGDYAFRACGGLYLGVRSWSGGHTDPIWRLHDVRIAFPSAEQAAAYHAERLAISSEGFPPVAGALLAGEDCRVFGGRARVGRADTEAYFYLFRVDSVVVKLAATRGPESAEPFDLGNVNLLARLIVSRVTRAVG